MNIEILKGIVIGMSLISIIGYSVSLFAFGNYINHLKSNDYIGIHLFEISFVMATIVLFINVFAIGLLLFLI